MSDKLYTLRQWVRMKAADRLRSRKVISVVVAEAVRQRELDPTLSVAECYRRASAEIVEPVATTHETARLQGADGEQGNDVPMDGGNSHATDRHRI